MALGDVVQLPLPFAGTTASPYQGQLFGGGLVPYSQGSLSGVLSGYPMPMASAPGYNSIPNMLGLNVTNMQNPQVAMRQNLMSAMGNNVALNAAQLPGEQLALPAGVRTNIPSGESIALGANTPPSFLNTPQQFQGSLFAQNGIGSPVTEPGRYLPALPSDVLPPPPTSAANAIPASGTPTPAAGTKFVSGPDAAELAALAEAETKQGLGQRLMGAGGGMGALAVPAASLALNSYVDRNTDPGALRDNLNTMVGTMGTVAPIAGRVLPAMELPGGMASTVAGPTAAVAGGVTLGNMLTQPGTSYNVADWLRNATNAKEQMGHGPNGVIAAPSASAALGATGGGSFADKLKAAVADTSILPDIKQGIDLVTGQKTDAGSADSTVDLLRKIPGVGALFGGTGENAAPQSTNDATIGNTNLDDRFKRLTDATKLSDSDSSQLKDLYNAMRATGASDEDAWKATQQGAMTSFQNAQQSKQDLGKLAALQSQVQKYMQPYIDRQTQLGQLQGQMLSGLAGSLPSAYQGVANYMAQNAPVAASRAANQYMQQALLLPSNQMQQQDAARQQQWQNMIANYELSQQFANMKNSGQLANPNNAIQTTG